MDATITDFMGGVLRECRELGEDWRWRRPAGLDRRLACLNAWTPLARILPEDPNGPEGTRLAIDPQDYRVMVGEARALAVLADLSPQPPEAMPDLVERLYGLVASRFDPPQAFVDAAARHAVGDWAAELLSQGEVSLPRAAMAYVEFLRLCPLSCRSDQVAALLLAALPSWHGMPMVPALAPADRQEEGYQHALDAGLDGDDAVWIAYVLGKARRYLRRMPVLAEGMEGLRKKWVGLFGRASFGAETGDRLAQAMTALPVIIPTFVTDTGIEIEALKDSLVLLFAADAAIEIQLRGSSDFFTVLPPALKLLL